MHSTVTAPPPLPDSGAAPPVHADRGLYIHVADHDPHFIEIIDDESVQTLRQALDTANALAVELVGLHQWPESCRYAVFQHLVSHESKPAIRMGGSEFADVFMAAKAAIAATDDLGLLQRAVQTAVEAAALVCPTLPDEAARQINVRLQEIGRAKMDTRALIRLIRNVAGTSNQDQGEEAMSPTALAKVFIDQQLPLIFFNGSNFRWSGTVWQPLEDQITRGMVTRFLQDHANRDVTGKLVGDVMTNLHAIAQLDCPNASLPFFVESRDPLQISRPNLIVFRNGMLSIDASTGAADAEDSAGGLFEFGETFHSGHDERFFNTVMLPFDYEPEADAPRWVQFLNQVLPVTSDGDRRQQVLQEVFGYTLLAGTCKFEKMMAMVGGGRNGKSTVMRVWERMLGSENVAHLGFDQLGGEFRLNDVVGKLANFSSDLPHLSKTHEGLLKQVIAGESVTLNRKFKAPLTAAICAKLVVACNSMPTIADTSEGMWRRLIIMPFNVTVPIEQVDPNLAETLCEELPGIFNWALAGLGRLLDQGRFTECEVCNGKLAEHRRDANTVLEFLAECCQPDPQYKIRSVPLYQVYRAYCEHRNRRPYAENMFGRTMKEQGYGKQRLRPMLDPRRPYVHDGLRLNNDGLEWARRADLRSDEIGQIQIFDQPDADGETHEQAGGAV
jgi:P4 family phage/plasmid primase-like protien